MLMLSYDTSDRANAGTHMKSVAANTYHVRMFTPAKAQNTIRDPAAAIHASFHMLAIREQ
jgi:hypothetical protein